MAPVKFKDIANPFGLFFVYNQPAATWVDIVPQNRCASYPFPFAPRGSHFVSCALANNFPFELGEGEKNIQGQAAERASLLFLKFLYIC